MVQATPKFDDSAGYERLVGRWSRAAAPVFLDWLDAPLQARWLDVGCGTGILTQAVIEACAPVSVQAIDSAAAQIRAAAQGAGADRASFCVADACRLPFPDTSFDVVASALVLNFIAERQIALAEMCRVARTHGLVAAFVWDFTQELSPSGPLRQAMRHAGAEVPQIPGADASRPEALEALFHQGGLEQIETRTIDVCLAYLDFDDFWQAQTPDHAPTTKVIAMMTGSQRRRLMRALHSVLCFGPNGSVGCCARAHAIKARVPEPRADRGVR